MKRPTEYTRPATVTWLVVGLFLALLPHYPRLPLWVSLLSACLVIWRVGVTWWNWPLASAVVRIPLTVFASVAVFSHYGTVFGRDAGVALFVTMLSLKLLESFRRRDLLLVASLSYFLIVTHFYYSQSIPVALYMILPLTATTAALIDMQATIAAPPSLRWRQGIVLLAQAVPLMVIMFFMFPRLANPFWNYGGSSAEMRTGLGDRMSPGSFTDLIIDDSTAFRVKFQGAVPGQKDLYWRGRVLWDYDGTTWNTDWVLSQGIPRFEGTGELLRYRVTLEPHDRRVLLGLDLPAKRPTTGLINQDFELFARKEVTGVHSYLMESYTEYIASPTLDAAYRRAALRLPDDYNPLTLAFGRQLRRRFPSDVDLIRYVLTRFNKQEFVYSFTPPLLGRHAVDEFLFDTREGFCEHYAGAFAVLLRAARIPARVVIGYQGGVYNPAGNYVLVRHSDAHAWTEAHLGERGWVRFDPTAMVAPERIRLGLSAALPETRSLFNRPWLRPLRLGFDAIQNVWNEWVVSYDSERRLQLFNSMGLTKASSRNLTIGLVVLATLSVLGVALITLRRLAHGSLDPLVKLYQQFAAKLARAGLKARRPNEGPIDYATRARKRFPAQREDIDRITALYTGLRYAEALPDSALGDLRLAVRALTVKT